MGLQERRPAVFLDRDGTINCDNGYTHTISQFRFLPSAVEGLKILFSKGYSLIVITNQAGIARGYYTIEDVRRLHQWVDKQLIIHGVQILEYLVCPHHPDFTGICACRKPGNILIEKAINNFNLERNMSWLIGDRQSDKEAAHRSGLNFIGVKNKSVHDFGEDTSVVNNLLEAAIMICNSVDRLEMRIR